MSNIIKTLQEKLGYSSFDKIDPNNQQNKSELVQSATTDHFDQAATIATLVGLYKFGTTEDGSRALTQTLPADLLQLLFRDKEEEVIEKVAHYGNQGYEQTEASMTQVAQTAISTMQQETGPDITPEKIRNWLAGQRHNILVYLPPDLNMGDAVNDTSIEDRTNKMEGPVSNLMHAIEDIFAEKDKSKEI
ncbi:hypothetical protein [Deminuibacter soli]|uniref:Uncharacterized protein n=1 Tax=Deminuibacter soli TaxID=2291815 RepID=A0A3E1NIW3_9BACT|nr:hypothetical protein [Deminuibacter soli]RFM27870.1 hypothetical protein DXN05_14350 [Deminuibacter soli]